MSIIRSGDALLEAVREVEPGIKVGKILIQRDESHPDKIARLFYSKLPPGIESMHVLLCDPMLATGCVILCFVSCCVSSTRLTPFLATTRGSAVKALQVLCKDNQVDPSKVIFANMICAPEGLKVLALEYPTVKIVTAVVDERLNDEKFIVPGLGDYGDRYFNTV